MRFSSVQPLAYVVPSPPLGDGLRLPHEPMSAGVARARVREVIAPWTNPVRVQDALLLTTELVSNAILHGWPEVVLQVTLTNWRLRVEVYDPSPAMPRARAAWAGGGRGLSIVEDLADAWGVEPHEDGGKTVWFTLSP